MHKIYENDDLMMYVKKRYCRCCGSVLQRRKTERIVKKGDPEHRVYCTVGASYHPHGDVLVIGREYYCEKCNQRFSCEEQGRIKAAQKEFKRKIVSLEEVRATGDRGVEKSLRLLKKMRWCLLIPVIGWFLCAVMIFNGKLSDRVRSKDFVLIMAFSMIISVLVACISRSIISLFPNFCFLQVLTVDEISLGLAALSFNIPTFVYTKIIEKRSGLFHTKK